MQDLHRFTWAKKRFTLLVDFTKGKHFGGWRQPWGSDFASELVSLRQSPPRFREWHPDKRLEAPRLAMRSCMGWILLMVAEVKMSQELELICSTCSVFHQGAKAMRFYIYIIGSSLFFTMTFVTWHVQLETQGRESAGHSCFSVASRGESPLFTMILLVSRDVRFQQLVVVCRGRGASSSTIFWWKRYEKDWENTRWRMNEVNQNRSPAVLALPVQWKEASCQCWSKFGEKKCGFVDVVHDGQCHHRLWPL